MCYFVNTLTATTDFVRDSLLHNFVLKRAPDVTSLELRGETLVEPLLGLLEVDHVPDGVQVL